MLADVLGRGAALIAADPATLAAALFLGAVALPACDIPACRATRVDPMVTLRCE